MRTQALLGTSLFFHGGIALLVGSVPVRPKPMETVSIKVAEPPKPKPKPQAPEPPPDAQKPDLGPKTPKPAATPKAAAAAAKPQAASKSAAAPSSGGSDLPDFGLSLGGDGPGLAVSAPGGGGGDGAREAGPAKTKTTQQQPKDKPKDDCEEAIVKPVAVRLPQPSYPSSVTERLEGKVRVEIQVDETGAVTGARVLSGLGPAFDAAALAAAKTASFKAATRCGKPVRSPFVVGIRFSP